MIKMLRVDYRLLHGQVAFSWSQSLGINAIFIISDTVKNDPLRLQALKLAKPEGTKVVVKSSDEAVKIFKSGVTDKYKVFVICEDLKTVQKVAPYTGVKTVNLGNIPFAEGKKQVSTSIFLNQEEVDIIKNMQQGGYELYSQMVPNDKKESADKLLKEMN